MIESGLRHERGSSAHLPFACTQRKQFLNFYQLEVSGARVILNVTAAFLGRNCSQCFFVKSVYICVSVHSPTHTHTFAPSGSAISRALRAFVLSGNVSECWVEKTSDCQISVLKNTSKTLEKLFSSVCLSWTYFHSSTCAEVLTENNSLCSHLHGGKLCYYLRIFFCSISD